MTSELPRFDPEPTSTEVPGLACAHGRLPLRAVSFRADVTGTTANVAVVQTFENPYDETLEVSYVFPLPELAAVTRCALVVGERTIAARLRERGEARDVYVDAVADGRRAALVEEERQGVFTATLGNLGPRERAEVRFELAFPLPREDGRLALRLPLVVGERYIPGAPLAGPPVGQGTESDTTQVQDASRITPPRLAPGADRPALAIEVAIAHGELAPSQLEASLHAVATTASGTTTVRVVDDGAALDRDFVLRFRLGDDQLRTQLALVPDADGNRGTFQLVVVPPASPVRARPRDVVLLLDRSGSMDGWKIVAARRALARMIEALDTDDRFAAFAFGSVTVACADLEVGVLHPATAHARARATEFVTGLSADGGTEMVQPFELATELFATEDASRDRWLVLVTDGQVGNEDELVALASPLRGVKILALGIDDAVNAALLGRLARATGGRVELVQDHEALEDALDRLHLLLGTPALERVTIAGERGLAIDASTIVPVGPLHAFPGVPLVVRGRYRGDGTIRVTARRAREPFELAVAGERTTNAALRACWAREQLLALEDRFVTEPFDRDTLHQQIVATSLDHGVLCRFTAFVATDDDRPSFAAADRHVQQPVEPPAIAPRASVPVSRFGDGNASTRATRTRSGTIRGKLAYLSPEQAKGQPIDERHEVFMLGVLLYELATGRRLWAGNSEFATLQAIVQGQLPAPLLPPELAALEPVLRRALASLPEARFDTVLAFVRALEVLPFAIAAPELIAAWLRTALGAQLAKVDALATKLARVSVPPGGYAVVARLGIGSDADVLLAAGEHGAVVLRRAHQHVVEDPQHLEWFLAEATLPVPGFVRIHEVGTDAAGGVFLAQDYIAGVGARELRAASQGTIPIEIALGVIAQAARALAAAVTLPDRSGGDVGVLLHDMTPSHLRIGIDGRTTWTALGRAPSPHLTAPRRTRVALHVPAGLLDPQSHAPAIPIAVGRWVVVPRGTRAKPAASRAGGWLRRATAFWRPR